MKSFCWHLLLSCVDLPTKTVNAIKLFPQMTIFVIVIVTYTVIIPTKMTDLYSGNKQYALYTGIANFLLKKTRKGKINWHPKIYGMLA